MGFKMTAEQKQRADFIAQLNYVQLQINRMGREMDKEQIDWRTAKAQFSEVLQYTLNGMIEEVAVDFKRTK